MSPLFLTPQPIKPVDYLPKAEAAKVAGTRLTSPPAYWDDEITQVLLREHPYIPLDRAIVNFTQRDDGAGCAMGFISVMGAPRLSIPVIIKNWELSPLDILINRQDNPGDDQADQQGSGDMTDDDVQPLTEESFTMALDAGSMGEPVPRHMQLSTGYSEDGSSLRLPFRGRTVLASYLGATETKKEEAVAIMLKNASIMAGFKLNASADVIAEWLTAPAPKCSIQSKLAAAQIPMTEALVLALPDSIESLKLSEHLAATVFTDDEATKNVVMFDALSLSRPTEKQARWMLFDDGSFSRAGEHAVGMAMDEKTAAAAVVNVLEKTATNSLRVGQHFVFHTDSIFTAPAKLAAMVARDDQRSIELRMLSDMSEPFTVLLDSRAKVAMHDDHTNSWVFPLDAKVLALGEHQEMKTITADKVAASLALKLPDQLTHDNGQWCLTLRGDAFMTQVPEAKVAELLRSHLSNADSLIAQAKSAGHVRFASSLPEQIESLVTKIAHYNNMPKAAAAAVDEVRFDMERGLKLAASLGDPESVDAILGASFLTEDNLAEFVGLADQFKETVSKLARLLLAIRMGLPGDETATTVAMKSLSRVADRLQSATAEVSA